MTRTKVAVLRGGPSEEYEISMQTGRGVLEALLKKNLDPIDVVINKQGAWIVHGFERAPESILSVIDVVFIALHGTYGEDGTVQRLLDRHGVPYTGSRAYPSSVALNKLLTKEQLRNVGIKMAPHLKIRREGTNIARAAMTIESLFGPEYVVKPINSGSSIGTRMAQGGAELIRVLKEALRDREEVMVEERIRGREATVGIVERFRDHDFYRLPAIEIIPPPKADYFSADVKYTGETEELCPGRFSREEKSALEEAAYLVHKNLELSQYSRSDFIISPRGVYFLEVNTLPGLTATSLVPKALQAVGCSYEDFVWHLISDALKSRQSGAVRHI